MYRGRIGSEKRQSRPIALNFSDTLRRRTSARIISVRAVPMARLHQTRSFPVTRASKTGRRCHRNKVCLKRLAQSAGNLDDRARVIAYCRASRGKDLETLDEDTRLVSQGLTAEPLKERWVALGLFCALACGQSCVWSTWSPIATSAMQAFPGWHKCLVALLSNWGCITYLTCCLACCWFIYKKGLLIPLRTAAVLSAAATFLRCVSSQEFIFTVMAHMAAILNGLSGVIIGPITALLSAVWFPRGERTTATGISLACNQFGVALSYLIGPAVVASSITNNTVLLEDGLIQEQETAYLVRNPQLLSSAVAIANTTVQRTALRVQIMSLMRIEFVTQLLLLVGVFCFFPRDPSCPLDTVDASPRFSLFESIKRLLKNWSMWKLCLAAAFSQGVTGPWLAMITMTFGATITQEEADRLAFWTILCGSLLNLIASRLTDVFQGHLRVAIYVLLLTSTGMFLWILLLANRVLVFHKDELYIAVILGIATTWSASALFLELASEIGFPVSEAIVGGHLIFLSNLIGALFYFSYFIPGFGEHWSTCFVFANLLVATVLVLRVKEEYNRTKTESQIELELRTDSRGQKFPLDTSSS